MEILLIYPYFLEERIHREEIEAVPIGLYSVAAVLRERQYDVEVLNWFEIDRAAESIPEILKKKRPQVIGFSIVNGNRWGAIEIARAAKQIVPKVKIVFGGIGAHFLWEHFLNHFPEIDYIVLGEGEYSFLNLIRFLESGGDGNPADLTGVAFRAEGKAMRTLLPEPIADLDALPIPADYFHYQHLSSSRGCTWQCTFCGSPKFWGERIRWRSPEHFVRELEVLYEKGIRFFYFSDDTFTIRTERVVEICRRIIEKDLKITWFAISRVTYVNEEVLFWMRKAGCLQISYGIESGSAKIREALNKQINTGHIKKAFALTTTYGILARAYFIYGSPGENWATIQETIDLMHEIKPLSAVFYILDIFPGTELYEHLRKSRGITDDIWLQKIEGILYADTDPSLSDELILAFGKRLREEFYGNVHRFAQSLRLIDRKDLYEEHADFCSRLGMTFSHGDYAKIESVKAKEETAERLFRLSLQYASNHRAYLGLGIIKQRKGEYEQSIRILSEGVKYFPESEDLNVSLGISYMNLQDFQAALGCFARFPGSKTASTWMTRCREAMGAS
jgi:anaerobic magnesium-protoporphyrin IX monomethyl ester cyclase